MMNKRSFWIAGAILLLLPLLALSRGFRVDLLPDKGRNFGCGTCHVNPAGGGARNSFGQDWEKIAIPDGDAYVDEIAQKDSDDDGFTNDEEFADGKHPGDPNSHPQRNQPITPRDKVMRTWASMKSDT